jgi:hypothetical protein
VKGLVEGTFRSLDSFNYRVWACGAIVSNVGTWMQHIAQDWLVLTPLIHNNATAAGAVMALRSAGARGQAFPISRGGRLKRRL